MPIERDEALSRMMKYEEDTHLRKNDDQDEADGAEVVQYADVPHHWQGYEEEYRH